MAGHNPMTPFTASSAQSVVDLSASAFYRRSRARRSWYRGDGGHPARDSSGLALGCLYWSFKVTQGHVVGHQRHLSFSRLLYQKQSREVFPKKSLYSLVDRNVQLTLQRICHCVSIRNQRYFSVCPLFYYFFLLIFFLNTEAIVYFCIVQTLLSMIRTCQQLLYGLSSFLIISY